MAHLWKQARPAGAEDSAWVVEPLRVDQPLSLGTAGGCGATLLHGSAGDAWLVVSRDPGAVAVNGVPLYAGLRVLADRDEIRSRGGERVFFSTERLAAVTPFPDSENPVPCPRCKDPIAAGTAAVRCPLCERWYHQSDDYPCWTYTDRCLCNQPTAIDAGFQWSPDGL